MFLHKAINFILVYMFDLLKAISFYKHVAKVKTNHLIMLKKNLMQAFSIIAGIKGNLQFLYRTLIGEGTLKTSGKRILNFLVSAIISFTL